MANPIRSGTSHPTFAEFSILDKFPFQDSWPFSPGQLRRRDETSDFDFYAEPRFVTHIDEGATEGISQLYKDVLREGDDVLDLCSSWISHLPPKSELSPLNVTGMGMNEAELQANDRLSSSVLQDLNDNPTLPFKSEAFDAVVNAVSVDYLARPQEVFSEINRVLKPGGIAVMTFSNRCFPTKVVGMWLTTSDVEHVQIVGQYYASCGAKFENVRGYKLKTNGRDPLFAVIANKPSEKAASREGVAENKSTL